jgi:hypothetical protein
VVFVVDSTALGWVVFEHSEPTAPYSLIILSAMLYGLHMGHAVA